MDRSHRRFSYPHPHQVTIIDSNPGAGPTFRAGKRTQEMRNSTFVAFCESCGRRQLAKRCGLNDEPRTLALQEWIVLALFADGGLGAVAGDDDGVVGQGEELVVQGIDNLLKGAAG
jgi:hypothetical protein